MRRPLIPLAVSLFALLASLALPAAARAQDPPATDQPGAEAGRDRDVYLPYRDLKSVFEKLGAAAVIPYGEYLQHWIEEHAPTTGKKPVEAVITSAAYTATIEKDLARIKAELTINVLGKPWVEVPIRFGEAAVGKVEGAGDKVLLRGTGDGAYSLLLGEAGEQKVTLELVARVRTSPDGREFAFESPTVGITTLELAIPEKDQTVEIKPRLVNLPVDAADGQTRVKANLGSTGSITARWHPRASIKPEMELLTSVTSLTQVSVEDGLIHTDAYLTYEVLRGQLEQVRIAVPKDHRILDVTAGAKVKGWKTEDAAQHQIVTVELLSGVEKQLTVEVHTERKLPDGPFDVAGRTEAGESRGIHALDAVRESGQVVLRGGADLTLTLTEQQGVIRIEAGQVAERIRADRGLAFKFYTPQFTLQALAKPVEPRITVVHNAQLVFHEDELRLTAALTYTVERAGIFELKLLVPDDLTIDDVQCPAMKEYNVDDASRVLTISLSQKTQGQIAVQAKGHRDYQAGSDMAELPLPLLEPQNVERETGSVYLYARESIEVVTNEQGVQAAQPLPAPPGQRIDDAQLTAAWSFTRRPVTIPVSTKRKSARLNAAVATTINVLPQSTEVTTLLDYVAQFAGIDTFQFRVPESVSDRVQIEAVQTEPSSPAIKQKTAAAAEDGWVTWTIVMQREVLGRQRFSITWDLKPAAAGDAAAPADAGAAGPASDEFTVQLVRALAAPAAQGRDEVTLTRVEGQIAIQKDRALSVSADATGGDVEPIDIRELTLLPQTGTLAFRYFKQPDEGAIEVKLGRTRHDIQEVVSTVVSRALVEIVTGEDETAVFRCRMKVKSTERQRLPIDLPVGLELLGVFVDDREVKLEKTGTTPAERDWESYYVNVARTKSSDEEFLLTFQFRWNVNPPLGGSRFGRGEIALPLPLLGGHGENAAPVQELRVVVWVPHEYALVGDPDKFVLDRKPRLLSSLFGTPAQTDLGNLDGWIGGGGATSFPTEGRVGYGYSNLGGARRLKVVWWNKLSMTLILSITVAVIAWILGRTSWENKLWVLLVAAFAAALVGLYDSHLLAHALSAAKYGLAFLVGWWLVTGLFGVGRRAAAVAATNRKVVTPPVPPPPETRPPEGKPTA
jgi:hypothetical protein